MFVKTGEVGGKKMGEVGGIKQQSGDQQILVLVMNSGKRCTICFWSYLSLNFVAHGSQSLSWILSCVAKIVQVHNSLVWHRWFLIYDVLTWNLSNNNYKKNK